MSTRTRSAASAATTGAVLAALTGCGADVPELEPDEPPSDEQRQVTTYRFGLVQIEPRYRSRRRR